MKFIYKRGSVWLITIVMTSGIIAAGCNSGVQGEQTNGTGIPITDFSDRKLNFTQSPQRIVSLGNGEVDIIYALGGTIVGRPKVDDELIVEQARSVPIIGSR